MGIPLPALHVQPPQQPDLLGEAGKMVALKSMIGQQQMQQLQIAAAQRKQQESQVIREAFVKNNGDIDKTIAEAAKNPVVQPETLQGLQQHSQQMKNLIATGDELSLKNMATRNGMVGQHAQSILNLPPEERQGAAQNSIRELVANGIIPKQLGDQQLQQITGLDDKGLEDYLRVHAAAAMSTKDQIETGLDARKTAAQEWKEFPGLGMLVNTRTGEVKNPEGNMMTPGMMESKYVGLQQKKAQGETLSTTDEAFLTSYKNLKTLVPQFNFNLQTQGVPQKGFAPGTTADQMYQSFGAKAGIIKGIVEGRQSAPSSFAQKMPFWQDVMEKVYQVDPQWSEQRAQLRKSYTVAGQKGADQINAINTVLGHLGNLDDAVGALKNGNVQLLNDIALRLGAQLGETPRTTLTAIVQRVGPELDRAYGASTGGERQATENSFNAKMSPDQLHSNAMITTKLLRSKISSLENQWDQNKADSMPAFKDRFIMPAAKAVVDKLAPEGGGKGIIYARDPQGKLHQAPAGTALPTGWKEEKQP